MNLWFRLWWYWLVIVTCGVTIFSISLVILPDFMQLFFNAMLFSSSQAHTTFDEIAYSYIKFLYGILGAVMVGWSVTLLFILAGPFHRGQREAWYAMTVSVLVWFVLDSSLSISSGFWQNAVFNTMFLIFFAIPLVATYRYFQK
ncbi:hypothetical protein [Nostoc sp. MG11]|uniref:hypothetical protein n=1 Tax=Nostoc sp. MG11 TaxID=2721166 RepID=UPI00186884EC|nr:hypothetical protein [Nostoc sp. MG11]